MRINQTGKLGVVFVILVVAPLAVATLLVILTMTQIVYAQNANQAIESDTTADLTPDIFSAVEGLIVALATLLSTVSGIIVYFINRKQSAGKEELGQRDERILEIAKYAQLGGQKTVENIGEIRQVAEVLYKLYGPPEEQKKNLVEIQNKIKPIIDEATERIDKGNQQLERLNGIMVKLMGKDANVNEDKFFQREDPKLSEKLRNPRASMFSTT